MAEVDTVDGGPVWFRNDPPNRISESPLYRDSDSTLHWIDIYDTPCKVYILPIDAETGDALGPVRILEVPFDGITVLCFRKDVPGSYICGYRQGIALLDEKTGEVTVLKKLISEEEKGQVMMNDGGIDPQGRLWVGEVDLPALGAKLGGQIPEGGLKPRGRLWRYETDGTCTQMETGIMTGNGIGWSSDGKYMYLNDSGPQTLWRYNFDGETGNISDRIKLIDGLPDGVLNDGMVVDQAGNLWIAMWMMNCMMVYSPDGKPLKKISLPAKCITCPAWGGKHNNLLFIASAQPLIGEVPEGDEGGHMFRYQTEMKGMQKYQFAG